MQRFIYDRSATNPRLVTGVFFHMYNNSYILWKTGSLRGQNSYSGKDWGTPWMYRWVKNIFSLHLWDHLDHNKGRIFQEIKLQQSKYLHILLFLKVFLKKLIECLLLHQTKSPQSFSIDFTWKVLKHFNCKFFMSIKNIV